MLKDLVPAGKRTEMASENVHRERQDGGRKTLKQGE